MPDNSYFLGNAITVSAIFEDSTQTLVDPTTVELVVQDPTGTMTTYVYLTDMGLIKDSSGKYHFIITANIAGVWIYNWLGIGTGQSSNASSFIIVDPSITPSQPPLFEPLP
jgi:hypothetical protein